MQNNVSFQNQASSVHLKPNVLVKRYSLRNFTFIIIFKYKTRVVHVGGYV